MVLRTFLKINLLFGIMDPLKHNLHFKQTWSKNAYTNDKIENM